jgi:type IV secretion system protein VirB10
MFSESKNTNNLGVQSKLQNSNSASSNSATFAGQGVNTAFGNQSMSTTSVIAKKIAHPEYTIASGEFLHAVLETAIDSDLPGEIRAVVSQPVYAYIGETPLIPAGSRLIGQYSSSVMQGQNRVFVVWNRVILPNGVSAQINSPGTDQLGISGQGADDVYTHFFARFGEASLLSIIGAGAATGGVNNGDQYNSAAQYRMAISQSFQQSANNSLQGTLATQPTLSIDQGASINVFVAHDIDFYSVMKAVS